MFLSGLQSSEGGLDVTPHSPGANTAVRSPANRRGLDIGFFCNNIVVNSMGYGGEYSLLYVRNASSARAKRRPG